MRSTGSSDEELAASKSKLARQRSPQQQEEGPCCRIRMDIEYCTEYIRKCSSNAITHQPCSRLTILRVLQVCKFIGTGYKYKRISAPSNAKLASRIFLVKQTV
ncbi:hypothetical protein V6N11_063898 [Hibiscus sabdariffa]|uniref:Uncharacterized protein n=1 Tax=Hibiscus sabdariffa TaxID=183260 RepID=A0ABR2PM33_9ROSI